MPPATYALPYKYSPYRGLYSKPYLNETEIRWLYSLRCLKEQFGYTLSDWEQYYVHQDNS